MDTNPNEPQQQQPKKQPAPDLVERAVLLFGEGGWRYRRGHEHQDIFFVHGPQGQCYITILVSDKRRESYCTCPTFEREKTCVHILALECEMDYLARMEAQELAHEQAEHPRYGCDPGFHWDRF